MFEIKKDAEKDIHNVIKSGRIVGGIFWMGGISGNAERAWNLVLMKKDEGMFGSIGEIRDFLESI